MSSFSKAASTATDASSDGKNGRITCSDKAGHVPNVSDICHLVSFTVR